MPESAPSVWATLPFAGLLLAIAVCPLWGRTRHAWERNKFKLAVSLAFSGLTLAYYYLAFGAGRMEFVLHHSVLTEYVPFLSLLFALYVISGGISLTGDVPAHPITNCSFLAAGTLLASFVGTTGASMLLIRPLLQTNSERRYKTHTVVFFIFLVSNVGGLLLPIGDPPLLLGYFRGVPFFWTLNLWPIWLVTSLFLLITYFVWDTLVYGKESRDATQLDEAIRIPLRLSGTLNLVWLLGVLVCVATIRPGKAFPGLGFTVFPFLREGIMLGLAGLSLILSPKTAREANQFNYHAILEVAALFIGIFICMQVPIEILREGGDRLSGLLNSPAKFFWTTGILSSVLDNAPTYVIFFELAVAVTVPGSEGVVTLTSGQSVSSTLLAAISVGAVFMGANSYIGNGPNFMVKSIAEQSGVAMPSFFGYLLYSGAILIPLFAVLGVVYF